jgi:PAS domain S-box-containing protein
MARSRPKRDFLAGPLGSHWRVTLIYGVFASLWIYLSDSALALLVPDHSGVVWWSLYKGLAFVAITTALLFWLTRRAVQEARSLGDQLVANLESITDAFCMVDNDWRITYINREGEQMLRCDRRQVIGKPLWEEFPQAEGTGSLFHQQFQKSRAERVVARFEEHYPPFDRWFAVRVFPSDQGLAIYFTDITERKTIDAQLLRAQRMDSLGALAGGIAHDLNNMLTPILMAIGLLKLGESDPSRLSLLDTIETSAQRGGDMVSQVLAFARGADGPRQALSVSQVVSEIAKIVGDTFPKNIVLKLELPSRPCLVTGDATQLHQVLLNLCVNARDAMPNGGVLTLRAEEQTVAEGEPEIAAGIYASIKVQDTGCGIPAKHLEKIFDPFFTTKEPGQGTGLGLASSLSIIKRHGGVMRVFSVPGEGTEFQLLLPVTESLLETSVAAVSPMPRGQGELILVVDDEQPVRNLLSKTLEKFGYRVVLAEHGAQAVEIYTEKMGDIAAVLTDLMMPVMDGRATIKAIRALNPKALIIITTGGGCTASELGADQFLVKPYTPCQLLRSLWDLRHETSERPEP